MESAPFGRTRAGRVELLDDLIVLVRRESTVHKIESECHDLPTFSGEWIWLPQIAPPMVSTWWLKSNGAGLLCHRNSGKATRRE